MTTWKDAPNRAIEIDGVTFTYRELGTGSSGIPVVFLHHLTAVLDDWDPRVIDGIAERHRVIAFDNRGVGATEARCRPPSSRWAPTRSPSSAPWASGRLTCSDSHSAAASPRWSRCRLRNSSAVWCWQSTGPRGAGGIDKMATIVGGAYLKAALTRSDPRNFLFFPRTPEGKHAATQYLGRLKERTQNRDKRISLQAGIAQIRAIRHAGKSAPDDLSVITHPVLVANGDNDLMVHSSHSADMARRLPDAQLKIYPNSGHGGVFQHHETFVADALRFLDS